MTALACAVRYEPSEDSVKAVLSAGSDGPELQAMQAMIASTNCTAQIEASKDDVRATWFTADAVAVPELPVVCTMTDGSGATLEVTTLSKVDCSRPDGEWSCQTAIRETTGLSFLGGVLEGMVNGNPALSDNLEELVTKLSAELGIDAE